MLTIFIYVEDYVTFNKNSINPILFYIVLNSPDIVSLDTVDTPVCHNEVEEPATHRCVAGSSTSL